MFTKSPAVDFAAIGLIKDQPAHNLAPGAWSDSLNIRAKDGSVQGVYKFDDDMILHNSDPNIFNGSLIAITQFTPAGKDFLVLAYIVKGADLNCHTVIYNTDSKEYDDITNHEADKLFTYNTSYPPQIFVFNEMLIVNPANDAPPQYTNASVSAGSLVELPNWDGIDDGSDEALVCRTLRPFNNRLIAMNVLEEHANGPGDDKVFPVTIIYSSVITAIGNLDTVFWATASTNTAGDAFMTQTPGKILDGMQLGPYFIAYKDDAVIQVRETGDSTFPLAFDTIFEDDGIYSSGCVAAIGNNQHIVWGNYGVYIHDGQTQKVDVAKGKVQDHLFDSVVNTDRDKSFVFKQTRDKEVWFSYSQTGNDGNGCNIALVFDYETQLWHKRSLPQLSAVTETEVNGAIKIYGANTTATVNPTLFTPASCIVDGTPAFDAEGKPLSQSACAQQIGCSIEYSLVSPYGLITDKTACEAEGGVWTDGSWTAATPANDVNKVKLLSDSDYNAGGYFEQKENNLGSINFKQLTSYYPNTENMVILSVAGTPNIGSTPAYAEQTFDPENSYKLDKRVSGRYMNVKVKMKDSINPKLTTVSFNLKGTARR